MLSGTDEASPDLPGRPPLVWIWDAGRLLVLDIGGGSLEVAMARRRADRSAFRSGWRGPASPLNFCLPEWPRPTSWKTA